MVSEKKLLLILLAAVALALAAFTTAMLKIAPLSPIEKPLFLPFPYLFSYAIAAAFFITVLLAVRRGHGHILPTHVEIPRPKAAGAMAAKLLLVVLDGAADKKIAALGKKTPLEAAVMPHLDWLSTHGHMGLLCPIPRIAPESDEAVLSILGYEPTRYYTGRGVIEAVGSGMDYEDGRLALRANFACVDARGNKLVSARPDLTEEELRTLVGYLNRHLKLKDAKFELTPGVGYRAALVIESKKRLSDRISDTHPGYKIIFIRGKMISRAVPMKDKISACVPLDGSAEAEATARLVNDFALKAYKLLSEHPINRRRSKEGKLPANFLLLRGASIKRPRLPDINTKTGHSWTILAEMPVEVGIGRLAGLSVVPVPPPREGDESAKYPTVAKKALAALKSFDCVYVHIKGPDIFAHLGDATGKTKNLESIDKNFFGPLLKSVDLSSTIICVTCDHTTSSTIKAHTADAVPLMIYAPGLKPDGLRFAEHARRVHIVSGAPRRGSLGKLRGTHLVPKLMTLMRHARHERLAPEAVTRAAAMAR